MSWDTPSLPSFLYERPEEAWPGEWWLEDPREERLRELDAERRQQVEDVPDA